MHKKDLEDNFLELMKLHEQIIYKIVSFYANQEHSTKDLHQEVILNLWKAYPSFRGDSKFSTWMYRIALNTCITFYRKNRISLHYTDTIIDMPDYSDNSENIKELYVLINRLNQIEKALLLLYLDEKPYKEIAEITGLSVTNVATRIGRIKDKLKKMSNE